MEELHAKAELQSKEFVMNKVVQRIVSWVTMENGAHAQKNVEVELKSEQGKSSNKLKIMVLLADSNP